MMKMELPLLHQMFHHLPEAVVFVTDSTIVYRNPTAELLFPSEELPTPILLKLMKDTGGEVLVAYKDTFYRITVSVFGPHRLFILRPQRDVDPPNVPCSIPARLRAHLSNLALTTEQLAELLSKEEDFSEYHKLLSIQTQAIYRILRLAKQMELSINDWEMDYPRSPMDLSSLCRSLSTELTFRLGGLGPHIVFQSDAPSLLISGSRPLIEQLVLALVSTAMKAAGSKGTVEINLQKSHGRVILSVWNDGPKIPENRLLQLFVPRSLSGAPRPHDGGGFDLWLAHRISLFHGGVIMAGNRPRGGSEFVLSIPLVEPKTFTFKSPDQIPSSDGFSPLLIALADALPQQVFDPLDR